MNRIFYTSLTTLLTIAIGCAPKSPPRDPLTAQAIGGQYQSISPSLVAVKYLWDGELNRREVIGAGIVVGDDGLVMTSLALLGNQIPDAQLKDFKIILPSATNDPEEIPATFLGRDQRTEMAFFKTVNKQSWKSVHFIEAPPQVGDYVYSVGILPKEAGYKSYLMSGSIATTLRGEMPQILVNGSLAAAGSPVFNAAGDAIGIVSYSSDHPILLNLPGESSAILENPPHLFIPTRFFQQSLTDPPSPEHPVKVPWIGITQMTGLTKDVAEIFNLKGQPAIQVGEVIRDTPADRAGIRQGDIIIKVDGQPLERGDEPEELPMIFMRRMMCKKVASQMILSILRRRDTPPIDITVTLAAAPAQANTAKRYFSEELGFAVRDAVFADTYERHLPADAKGVIVSVLRPQGPAEAGELHGGDMVLRLDGEVVQNVEDFKTRFEKLRADKPHENIVMVVLRAGADKTIKIEPPQ